MTPRQWRNLSEILSMSTHAFGGLVAIACLVLLVVFSAFKRDPWAIVSCSIFGTTMIFMYTMSAVYHGIRRFRENQVLKRLDHIAIYMFIAGTYTPIVLVPLHGTLGWILFGVVWGLAILGTLLKIFVSGDGKAWWSITLYVVMGWLIIFDLWRLYAAIPHIAFLFLFLGGVSYTTGVLFYMWRNMPMMHVVWHMFVLGGSVLHFFAILYGCVLVP